MNPGLELVMTLRAEIAPSLEWNTVYLMDTITVLRAKGKDIPDQLPAPDEPPAPPMPSMYPPPVAPAS